MTDPHRGTVYPDREDSALLLPVARGSGGRSLLEIGCGRGSAALAAARAGARVVATDLNPSALRSVRAAAREEGLRVAVVRTDLAAGLGRFDRILANPPYLPTPPAARDPDPWVNLALDGGPDGLTVTRRLFATIPEHLRPGGRAYLVVSSRQAPAGLARIVAEFAAGGGRLREVARRSVGSETLRLVELASTSDGPGP